MRHPQPVKNGRPESVVSQRGSSGYGSSNPTPVYEDKENVNPSSFSVYKKNPAVTKGAAFQKQKLSFSMRLANKAKVFPRAGHIKSDSTTELKESDTTTSSLNLAPSPTSTEESEFNSKLSDDSFRKRDNELNNLVVRDEPRDPINKAMSVTNLNQNRLFGIDYINRHNQPNGLVHDPDSPRSPDYYNQNIQNALTENEQSFTVRPRSANDFSGRFTYREIPIESTPEKLKRFHSTEGLQDTSPPRPNPRAGVAPLKKHQYVNVPNAFQYWSKLDMDKLKEVEKDMNDNEIKVNKILQLKVNISFACLVLSFYLEILL